MAKVDNGPRPRPSSLIDEEQEEEKKANELVDENDGRLEVIEELRSVKVFDELLKMRDRLARDMKALDKLKNRDIVFMMGLTGAGKSTLMNAIYSGIHEICLDEEHGYDTKQPIVIDGMPMFKIGHSAESCTEMPGYVPLENKILIDAPGLGDANALKEYPN